MPRVFHRLLIFTLLLLVCAGCGKSPKVAVTGKIADAQIAHYVETKHQQAREWADAGTNKMPDIFWQFFVAVEKDDFKAVTNLQDRLELENGRYGRGSSPSEALNTEIWHLYVETIGIYETYREFDNKWLHRFADDIIRSIPPNSIYFGGTDPGRFAISAFSESHSEGKPFFTLTQNALADGSYLDYLRKIYGAKIQIVTPDDSEKFFREYISDAQMRLRAGKLDAGEDVKVTDGRVQVSGQVAVMKINALLASRMVELNPNREFFLEESYPLELLYPNLEPHGLIFKLHKNPLPSLSDAVIGRDREYWKSYAKELIGDWVTDETPVKQICEFIEKVHLRQDFSSFKGDADFAKNYSATKMYSSLRGAIGNLYAWRAEHTDNPAEKKVLLKEAEFAYRQALAFGPHMSQIPTRYVNLLLSQKRQSEARLVAELFARLEPRNESTRTLLQKMEALK